METERCKKLVATIQQLEQTEMEELFKLLHSNGCQYTSNNHGVFLNLSWLPEDVLQKIETYVAFCVRSRCEVKRYESLCDVLKTIQQTKKEPTKEQEKEVSAVDKVGLGASQDKRVIATSRVSSSMKFYLLKKRYAKQTVASATTKSDLHKEDFCISI